MTHSLDPTFRSFNSAQASAYAANRGTYSSNIIQEVIAYHDSTGGERTVVLDVGCGTGQATQSLAPYFSLASGCDPSKEMIARAKETGSKGIHYEVLEAENLEMSTIVQTGTVDLLTAAMAAHWFQMDRFWPQAALMVKPGGTVALWTQSSLYCHPSTTNADGVQKALSHLEDNVLASYETVGNKLSRTMYSQLTMPWSLQPPITSFGRSKSDMVCHQWDRDGKLASEKGDFFGGSNEMTLKELADSLRTASMVSRWREANPQIEVEHDCVAITMNAVAEAMGMPTVSHDQVKIRVGSSTTLLLFTRAGDE
ncbi:S-adenosyl-L-methionine-dependent methyltransferase [Jackrogersella minutella]|nr:S-adenosyl-L-methionine-dependent methyltransferase [Jackrogersella minutella]